MTTQPSEAMRRHPTRIPATLLAAASAGLCALLIAGSAHAQRHDDHFERGPEHFDRTREHIDGRFHHDHVYLNRGVVVSALPREHYEVVHGGAHYFFAGGVWYAPRGPRWVVVAPPIGVYVPVLPPFYTTLWVGGIPYYYADDVYYVYRGPAYGYEVVTPPPDTGVQAPAAAPPPPSTELYIYPKNGQSEQQQAQDRYECHSWASSQTGFDPTAPNGGVSPDQAGGRRADYDRAMSACLEARGYTVK